MLLNMQTIFMWLRVLFFLEIHALGLLRPERLYDVVNASTMHT